MVKDVTPTNLNDRLTASCSCVRANGSLGLGALPSVVENLLPTPCSFQAPSPSSTMPEPKPTDSNGEYIITYSAYLVVESMSNIEKNMSRSSSVFNASSTNSNFRRQNEPT